MHRNDEQLDQVVELAARRRSSSSQAHTPQIYQNAKAVVTDPARYAHRFLLRRMAWISLMEQRGCRVDQSRLARLEVEARR